MNAADGSCARLSTWSVASEVPPDLTRWADPPQRLGLLLIRRGGYAVGRAEGEQLVRHRTGTRYVQGRTAAGGWSQQRYARRRANQVGGLVSAATDVAREMLLDDPPEALALGGDGALGRQLLDNGPLTPLATLPRRELFDIADPRLAVLRDCVARARAVLVSVHNADTPSGASPS